MHYFFRRRGREPGVSDIFPQALCSCVPLGRAQRCAVARVGGDLHPPGPVARGADNAVHAVHRLPARTLRAQSSPRSSFSSALPRHAVPASNRFPAPSNLSTHARVCAVTRTAHRAGIALANHDRGDSIAALHCASLAVDALPKPHGQHPRNHGQPESRRLLLLVLAAPDGGAGRQG
eukprot:scaffold55987_cov72-Phaeocystis_antarctica.AAC.5